MVWPVRPDRLPENGQWAKEARTTISRIHDYANPVPTVERSAWADRRSCMAPAHSDHGPSTEMRRVVVGEPPKDLFGSRGEAIVALSDRGYRLADPLFPEEEQRVAAAVPMRRRQYRSGRSLARRALHRLGLGDHPIPSDAQGAPVWPRGCVGSLAHGAGEAVVAVARSADIVALGIDVEEAVPLPCDVVEIVLIRADHSGNCAGLPLWKTIAFSAKEAVYKAYFPLWRRFLDFDAVAIVLTEDGGFTVEPQDRKHSEALFLSQMMGRWAIADGRVYTAVSISGRDALDITRQSS